MRISIPVISFWIEPLQNSQSRLQNKFGRLARTTDLFRPISDRLNGWRTQFMGEMTSGSSNVTRNPAGWPYTSNAWCRYRRSTATALPLPPQPTSKRPSFTRSVTIPTRGIQMSKLTAVVSQLRQEHSRLRAEISIIETVIRSLSALNGNALVSSPRRSRKISADGKARIVAAQRKRWAAWRRAQKKAA